MNFNDHSRLAGKHAFLSPSKYHWLHYDHDKLVETYNNAQAAEKGTQLHALACELIKNGLRLEKAQKTINLYVNDAIKYHMEPEVVLMYSDICFGTADAISYRRGHLRIHDLKTGVTPAHMEQLEIYAAMFFLEYGTRERANPENTEIELRIYQMDEVIVHKPSPEDIRAVMDIIVESDQVIQNLIAMEA